MKFIITGTGRSGSKWCATVLRLAGIYAGHEQAFLDGNLFCEVRPVELGKLDGDCSYAAMPVLKKYPWKYKNVKKILVTRHPYKTAHSYARNGSFIEKRVPLGLLDYISTNNPDTLKYKTDFEIALSYWDYWINEAAKFVDEVVRLEDLTPESVVELVGVRPKWDRYTFDERVNVSFSGIETYDDELEPELFEKVKETARKFGYNLN